MMMNGSVRTCPACKSSKTRQLLTGNGDQERQIQRPFCFFLCQACRLRFQVVPSEEAKRLYGEVEDVAPRTRERRRKELRFEEDVLRMVQKLGPGKHLLDIGSGNGHLLAAALKNDFACLGTDVSDRLAEAARRRSGAEVLVGDLASLELPSESFDVVNLDQVMSYVTDPLDFMHQVARLLRPGGICRIREYDPDSLNARVKGGRYWMYAPTRINLWPGKSISLLGARVGLPVYRIFAGTEASLTNWLATGVGAGFWSKARDTLRFVGRKSRLFSTGLAADTVYYLRKSG